MKTNPILEEVWRIKDELSREFAADPDAYFAKLDEITNAEEKAGRKVIRSAAKLQQLVRSGNVSTPRSLRWRSTTSQRPRSIDIIQQSSWPNFPSPSPKKESAC